MPYMVGEVSRALSWTLDHIGGVGGDPNKVGLVGGCKECEESCFWVVWDASADWCLQPCAGTCLEAPTMKGSVQQSATLLCLRICQPKPPSSCGNSNLLQT